MSHLGITAYVTILHAHERDNKPLLIPTRLTFLSKIKGSRIGYKFIFCGLIIMAVLTSPTYLFDLGKAISDKERHFYFHTFSSTFSTSSVRNKWTPSIATPRLTWSLLSWNIYQPIKHTFNGHETMSSRTRNNTDKVEQTGSLTNYSYEIGSTSSAKLQQLLLQNPLKGNVMLMHYDGFNAVTMLQMLKKDPNPYHSKNSSKKLHCLDLRWKNLPFFTQTSIGPINFLRPNRTPEAVPLRSSQVATWAALLDGVNSPLTSGYDTQIKINSQADNMNTKQKQGGAS